MVCGIDVRAHPPADVRPRQRAGRRRAARCIAVIVAIQPEMGQIWTFKSFLVIVLGGAGNYPGALLGGLLLGLVEQLASLFLTTQLSEVGRLRAAGAGAARAADRSAGRPPDVSAARGPRPGCSPSRVVGARRLPGLRHRLRRPLDAAALHVDRAGRLLEPHLRTHRLRLVRPRRLLRHRRLHGARSSSPRPAGRGRRPRWPAASRPCVLGAGDRLSVPAAQGPVLRHRDARAQRGAARARVVLRGADGRRQRAVAADAAMPRVPIYYVDGR